MMNYELNKINRSLGPSTLGMNGRFLGLYTKCMCGFMTYATWSRYSSPLLSSHKLVYRPGYYFPLHTSKLLFGLNELFYFVSLCGETKNRAYSTKGIGDKVLVYYSADSMRDFDLFVSKIKRNVTPDTFYQVYIKFHFRGDIFKMAGHQFPFSYKYNEEAKSYLK